ncbi:hypothetical protein AGMMS49579_01220 [Spirochaetia bacterium]|nr:hypothetical protein AGMMS49579_01220 [Spirochaetia bacterium]
MLNLIIKMEILNEEISIFNRIFEYGYCYETIQRLISLLTITQSYNISNILLHICIFVNIPEEWMLQIAYSLPFKEHTLKILTTLGFILNVKNTKITLFEKVEKVFIPLFKTDIINIQRSKLFFKDFFNTHIYNEDIKYKIFKLLHTSTFLDNNLLDIFLNNVSNEYKIYASQLTKYTKVLIEILQNTDTNDIDKANAADILLSIDNSNILAKHTLDTLAFENSLHKTIYTNKQNIHDLCITESCLNIFNIVIQKLRGIKIINLSEKDIVDQSPIILKVYNRIKYLDNFMYKTYSLNKVMDMIWTFIHTLDEKEDLKIRFFQEMEDMYNTCSSGYFMRFINVLSGFNTFNIDIGWKNRIQAIIFNKMNKLIENDVNKDLILLDITNKGSHYKSFFIKNLSTVTKDIEQEFFDVENLDIFIKDAIISYTG